MPGDNFFRGFPNVAPIRGSRLRSPDAWLTSLDRVIALAPQNVDCRRNQLSALLYAPGQTAESRFFAHLEYSAAVHAAFSAEIRKIPPESR